MNLLPFELPILDASNGVLLVHAGILHDAVASSGAARTGAPPVRGSIVMEQFSAPYLPRLWLYAGLI